VISRHFKPISSYIVDKNVHANLYDRHLPELKWSLMIFQEPLIKITKVNLLDIKKGESKEKYGSPYRATGWSRDRAIA
jgi:hypothetical protein